MRKFTKSFGLLFLATASVYAGQSSPAKKSVTAFSEIKSDATATVKLLDETPATGVDPFETVAPETTNPATEGTSVSAAEVNVSDAGTVEIHVNNASLVEVLRMLSLQSQKNIIASKDVRGTVTANLYDVTVREALDAILHANGYAYREQGSFIYVYTAKEMAEIEKSERKASTEVFRLYYTPAANAVVMIKPVLSADAQVSFTTPATAGLASGTSDVGGNSHAVEDLIVINDYPDNLARVREILKEVDRRPQQILIEATILRASLSEDNALGVDFTVLGGVDFSTLNNAGATAGQALSGQTINNPQAGGITDKGYAGGGTGFTGGVPQGGLRLGLVYNNMAIFLSALESVTDTVVLANPKVLALNKQKGEVIVGRKDGYLTTTVTESSSVQTVEFLDTGTRLIFRPFIGDDGFIRMEIHPEDSSGGLTGANLPFKITTEVTSNVMVKDGHTIVIGGLFRESTDSARGQVPFLGNLPLAGPLFRNQRDRTTREEIIILLTPHIVKDDSAYSKESEEMLKDTERLRVGVRRGMMWFGRERLAESNYQEAVEEMSKPVPNRKKALWHLNCATNLNPKFLEAIKMKEMLTGEIVSTTDSSSIRSFVKRSILSDFAPTTQPMDVAPLNQESPATQPTVHSPATPLEPLTPVSALGPTTLPADTQARIEKVEGPATKPTAEMSTSGSSVWTDMNKRFTFGKRNDPQPLEAPATQPETVVVPDKTTGGVIITELPTESDNK